MICPKEKKKKCDMMGGGEKKKKQLSGAQKRKKKKEKEELAAEMERLKLLGPSKLWTGLVLHHKDVFVSHVLSKLNTRTDRYFFSEMNRESRDVLKYAGVNVSKIGLSIQECSSISTLELHGVTCPGERKMTKEM